VSEARVNNHPEAFAHGYADCSSATAPREGEGEGACRRSREAQKNAVSDWLGRYRLLPVIALVAVTVVGSVLAVGTVHVKVLLCVAPLAILAGAWSIGRLGRGLGGDTGSCLAAVFSFRLTLLCRRCRCLQACCTCFQPATASTWIRALAPLGVPVSWLSLSLDPSASVAEALKWFCYGSMFCAGAAIAKWSEPTRRAEHRLRFRVASCPGGSRAPFCCPPNRCSACTRQFSGPATGIAPLMNSNNLAGYPEFGGLLRGSGW